MKKFLTLFLLSTFSIPSIAQTINELETQILQLEQENQSLTLQNNNYDLKLQEKQKQQAEAEMNLKALQAKRIQSEEACKSISESDLKIIAGLSGGTIALSAIGTTGGILQNTGAIDKMISSKQDKSEEEKKEQTEPSQPEQTLHKATTQDKVLNIGTTVTSAGSTITSAIALSKVNSIKNDIEKCIDSFK